MAIDSVTGATTDPTNTTGNVTSLPANTDALGRDAFLKLLVTQLQHQNPLEPQPDGEFLAQLAQFSSLESLQGIQQDMAALRSAVVQGSATTPAA
jgi:flagellar basal-body rod modification protein FlgD